MSTYIRLTDYKDSDSKEQGFFKSENRYEAKQDDFEKIPGSPIAYWISDNIKKFLFSDKVLEDESDVRKGLTTSNDDQFLKLWHEININDSYTNSKSNDDFVLTEKKWAPLNKGGDYRKWYGNFQYFINWSNNGEEIKNFKFENGKQRSVTRNLSYSFLEGVTWNAVGHGKFCCRFVPPGFMMNDVGPTIYNFENNYFLMSFMMSNIGQKIFNVLCPTMKFEVGQIQSFPILNFKNFSDEIKTLAKENINISKEEWDSRETSWDFTKNELLKHKSDLKLETAYNNYCQVWSEKFYKLHANEEELNRLFIDIYELNDELTPDVDLKDITILKSESIINEDKNIEFKADEIMKQFISYTVGVMFGRYSLDKDGLQIANLGSEILI